MGANVNPFAEIVKHDASTPLPLMNLGHSNRSRCGNELQKEKTGSGVKRFCGSRLGTAKATHLEGVESLTLVLPAECRFLLKPLKALLSKLLAGDLEHDGVSMDAWRVKGLVCSEIGVTLVQGVGDQVEFESWPHGMDVGHFLVVIGEHLQREHIEKELYTCVDVVSLQALGSSESRSVTARTDVDDGQE